jgi:hypothetical protein
MITEGRPFLGPDATYEKQRKCRMQDAIDDYLQDDRVSIKQTYEEMLSCIDDVITYHKTSLDRAVNLKSLMVGHRDVNLDFPMWPGEVTSYQYNDDKILLTEE